MCRLLGYIGSSTPLDYVLTKPEHSLIVQSYQPQEMTSGTVNADGFGIGWYHPQTETAPFTYKNVIPIWNDVNLPSLGRYVESECVLGCVRSATAGQAIDLSNCQPFEYQNLLCVHNGKVEDFRHTLRRPLCDRLGDVAHQSIKGTTDSEHFFALVIDQLQKDSTISLAQALQSSLQILKDMATAYDVIVSANMIISDGHQLVASRFALGTQTPSLYWLRDDPAYPQAVLIASEPLFAGDWHPFPEQSVLSVGKDLDVQLKQI